MQLPYPAFVVLTVIYISFVCIVSNFAPECVHQPCNSEGLDNTTVGWATDFFVSVAMFISAIHLILCRNNDDRRQVDKAAISSQIYMGIAYLFGGIVHLFFPNSGWGDGYGMLEFYITWALAYTFTTLSAVAHFRFIMNLTKNMNQDLQQQEVVEGRGYQVTKEKNDRTSPTKNKSFDTTSLEICLALVLVSAIGIFAGCLWCSLIPSMHTRDIIDEYPNFSQFDNDDGKSSPSDEAMCIRLMMNSEVLLFIFYPLLWIPASNLLLNVINHQKKKKLQESSSLWGMSNSLATILIPITQWTIGFSYIIYIAIASMLLDVDITILYPKVFGSIVSHYGSLITFYFTHHLAYTLSIINKGEGQEEERDVYKG